MQNLTYSNAISFMSSKQCAAVRMYLSLITEPPQKCELPSLSRIPAANGNS